MPHGPGTYGTQVGRPSKKKKGKKKPIGGATAQSLSKDLKIKGY